ncbi:MAG: hypothetical protein J6S71_01250 [Clostridia bacterium]|nr:hypothetical protein [Clostridia bacterium]
MLKIVFNNFDNVNLFLDDEQIEVKDDIAVLDIDSNLHKIRVYNSGVDDIDSIAAIGYKPKISIFSSSAEKNIVNHIIAWRENYSLCVWEGTVRAHRDSEISFFCSDTEYKSFLMIRSMRKRILAKPVSNIRLSYVSDDGYVRFNGKQSAFWLIANLLPLIAVCAVYSLFGILGFCEALTNAEMIRRSVFLVLSPCLSIYGIGKFIFFFTRLIYEVKNIST